VPTVEIVKAIRCEALAGIDSLRSKQGSRADPIIAATVIGYDFNFDITENNDLGPAEKDGNLLTFANGKKTKVDLTANASLQRRNRRLFTIIEPLISLDTAENRDLCSNRSNRANWAYPITGTIGLDEVVRTYLRLEMLAELQLSKNAPTSVNLGNTKFKDKSIVFADALNFTTDLQVGGTATLVLDAVVGRLKVTNVSIGASASRRDIHLLTVALARKPGDIDRTSFRTLSTKTRGSSERRFLARDGARDPRTQTRLIQMDEDTRTTVAMELYRRRSLDDVDNAPAEALGQRLLDVLKVP
jgi:hypothetical protein